MPSNTEDLNQSFDAQQLAEDIEAGEEKQPEVNVEDDYEASKAYSASAMDQDASNESDGKSTSADPDTFRNMAKQVKPNS